MNSDKVQQLNSAIESKLSEILPDLAEIYKEYGLLELFEFNLKLDVFSAQANTTSEMVHVLSTGCGYKPGCGCMSCDSVPIPDEYGHKYLVKTDVPDAKTPLAR